MVALKSRDADRFLAKPDGSYRVVLFFGPDPGGVTEGAERLARTLAGKDPHAIVRIESDELAADPGRLSDEVYGQSLFSSRRIVRVKATGSKSILPSLEPLFERPPDDAWVIVEAGDLRKTAPLRKAAEGASIAAAIGCYVDDARSLGRILDEEAAASGLAVDADARTMVVSLLGADRIASRSEIRKLCLYAQGSGRITREDVAAAIGDGAAVDTDEVVDAAGLGDTAALDRGLRRLAAAGSAPFTAASAALRHFQSLHRTRAAGPAGGGQRPVHFSRKDAIDRQLKLWSRTDLDWALERIRQAIAAGRITTAMEPAIIAEALTAIALRARKLSRSPQPD